MNSNELLECPFCCEKINSNAIKCKHCHSFLNVPQVAKSAGVENRDQTETSVLAYVSLALVILSFFLEGLPLIPGLVCAHVALSSCNRNKLKGKGAAIAALIIGYLLLIAIIIILVFALLLAIAST